MKEERGRWKSDGALLLLSAAYQNINEEDPAVQIEHGNTFFASVLLVLVVC